MNEVQIINIVPCCGKVEGKSWKNTVVVYIENSPDATYCRIDKGVRDLANKKIPSCPVILLYDRFGRVVGWQSDK